MAPSLDTREPATGSLTFQEMLDGIRKVLSRPDSKVDVDQLWQVLESYNSNPNDWNKFAYYDNCKYKRNLVDEHENYNVMLMAWGPNTESCIHNHSGSHCFMKILDGKLVESRFAWPKEDQITDMEETEQEMSLISNAKLGENEVLYINDKVGLHRVENPDPNRTSASLHVYIPPIRYCKAFDQRTGKAKECQMTFYSKCGKIVQDEDKDQDENRPLPKQQQQQQQQQIGS